MGGVLHERESGDETQAAGVDGVDASVVAHDGDDGDNGADLGPTKGACHMRKVSEHKKKPPTEGARGCASMYVVFRGQLQHGR